MEENSPSHNIDASAPKKIRAEPAGPKPRLIIQEIVLQDFKSYGGRKVVGPFHECFSAILGPNGSGKSNIIDAMLFLFGRRASEMRHSKLRELIHNSDANNQPSSCRVEVAFVEILDISPGKFQRIEGSELRVAREVQRSNSSSKYYLNGKTTTEKEISAVFLEKGIDLDRNRFLILQGQVEQIAMMKPKASSKQETGLLEFLEELIGSNQFVQPIEEKEKEVEELTEKKLGSQTRVRHAEKEKLQLEGPRKQAELYVKTYSEQLQAQALYAQLLRRKHSIEAEQVKQELFALQINHTALVKSAEDEQVALREYKDNIESSEKEVKRLRSENEKKRAEVEKLEKDYDQMDEEKKLLIEEQKKTQKTVDQEKAKMDKLSADLKVMQSKLVPLHNEQEAAEQICERETSAYRDLLHSVKAQTAGPSKQKAIAEEKLQSLVSAVKKTTSEINVINSERNELVGKHQKLVDSKSQLTTQVDESSRSLKALSKDLAEAKSSLEEFKEKAEVSRNAAQAAVKEIEKAQRQHHAANSRVGEIRGSLANSGRDSSSMLTEVLSAKRSGSLSGIHGVVKDLGSIDAKYQTALNVALGAQGDNFVVSTADDGSRLVDFVKQRQLGRATCHMLDKLQRFPLSQRTPSPRLVDLVEPASPELRDVFVSILRDTLVCDNLQQARQIAFGEKRWRVVTLSGEIIETSGAMSSGAASNKPSKPDCSEADLARAEQTAVSAKQALDDAVAKRDRAEQENSGLVHQIRKIEDEIKQLSYQVTADKEHLKSLESRLQAIQAQSGESISPIEVERINELDRLLVNCEKKLADAKTAVTRQTEQINEFERLIVSTGGNEVKAQKEKLDAAKAAFEEAEKECGKLTGTISKTERTLRKVEEALKTANDDLAKCDKGIEVIVRKSQVIEDQALPLGARVVELKKLIAAAEQSLEKAKAELDRKEEKYKAIKRAIDDSKEEISKCEVRLQDWDVRVKEQTKAVNKNRKDHADLIREMFIDEEEQNEADRIRMETSPLGVDLSAEYLDSLVPLEVQTSMLRLEAETGNMRPNMKALADFREKLADFNAKKAEFDMISQQREEVKLQLEDLRKQRLDMFTEAYNLISMKLKELYRMLTIGGDAEMEFTDASDPFSKGITFSVRPPKKSWKQITNLSGGEKTLSSLALVFALHYFKPTPLYFLDEIDAALDQRNVAIIANYIKSQASGAQFIVVSLRNNMFEIADWLVGVYKTDNISKTITLDPVRAAAK